MRMKLPESDLLIKLLSPSIADALYSKEPNLTKEQYLLWDFFLEHFDSEWIDEKNDFYNKWDCVMKRIRIRSENSRISWQSIRLSKKIYETFDCLAFPIVISCRHGYWQKRMGACTSVMITIMGNGRMQDILTWGRLSDLIKNKYILVWYDGGVDFDNKKTND